MDNIVDYLVVGFFIISFLSSIFKKKKKGEAKGGENPIKAKPQKRVVNNRNSVSNPFDDFFKSINNELANAKTEVSRSEVDEYYEKALQNSDDSEIANMNRVERTKPVPLIPEVTLKKKENAKDNISIKSYSESVEFSKGKHESKKAIDMKKRLLENNSIKDFIIMNEILGKPKALQR